MLGSSVQREPFLEVREVGESGNSLVKLLKV